MERRSLLDCPHEVQLQIAGFLRQAALANLCMTNRALHNLSEPLVYSAIQITWTRKHLPPVAHVQLLRTLLRRQDLCKYVRSLEFAGNGFSDSLNPPKPGQKPAPPAIPSLPLNELTAAVKSLDLPQSEVDAWVDRAQSGFSDTVAAILISLLPMLEELCLCANWVNKTVSLRTVFRLAFCGKSQSQTGGYLQPFSCLRSVSIAPKKEEHANLDPENTAEALPLFYLPTIEHLSVPIDNPTQFSWPCSMPPNPSFLTSLELFRLRETRLGPILSATKNLKKLRYNWVYRPDLDREVSTHVVMLDVMAEAFLYVRNSLEELEITADTFPAVSRGDYEPPEIEFQASLSQLCGMHKLRTLNIPWSFLIGMDNYPDTPRVGPALPDSLEHLTLGYYYIGDEMSEDPDNEMISSLEVELESGSLSHVTKLKSVSLPQSYDAPEMSQACRDMLDSLGARFNLLLDSERDTE
ncbi:hypothetical protein HG530_008355 [Fusarium avenaceum]|nr:hypothetical protein HG530_008355 [Fusarium avenaceum]